jgi:hypothetical protein
MKVPLIDLSGQYQSLRPELLQAVARIIDSQEFVLGSEVIFWRFKGALVYCNRRSGLIIRAR